MIDPEELAEKRFLIIATGGSGVGKTQIAGTAIDAAAQKHKLPPPFVIKEYDIVKGWFRDHIDATDLMHVVHSEGDTPDGHKELTHEGYDALFSHVANVIIAKFKQNRSAKIVRTEAARNLEISYFPLFSQLVRELGDETYFANIHLTVNNSEVLKHRAIHRLDDEPDAAPWAIVEMYDSVKADFPSSVDTAALFPEFILNDTVENGGDVATARATVQALFANVFAAYSQSQG